VQTFPEQIRQYAGDHWDGKVQSAVHVLIAEEVPVALVYNGTSHAVMLATPQDLEDFAIGFSLSEAIVESAGEIHDIEVTPAAAGIEVSMMVASRSFFALKARRRSLAGRTGRGVRGTESLEQAVRHSPKVARGITVYPEALHRAFAELHDCQHLHNLTGAVHAAAWADPDGKVLLVREDVGRHNALDKLIGVMARRGLSFVTGFAAFTSRASCEMMQKSATVGITLIAATSAPTGLAIRLAEESRVTLVGFVRQRSHTVYANPNPQRIWTDRCRHAHERRTSHHHDNQIGAFFESQPDRNEAVAGVADHLRRFWDPRLRRAIGAHIETGGEGLKDIVAEQRGKAA
jgi:FdhD protein